MPLEILISLKEVDVFFRVILGIYFPISRAEPPTAPSLFAIIWTFVISQQVHSYIAAPCVHRVWLNCCFLVHVSTNKNIFQWWAAVFVNSNIPRVITFCHFPFAPFYMFVSVCLLVTGRKRSLGQVNVLTLVCHSVEGGCGWGSGVGFPACIAGYMTSWVCI